MVYFSGTSGLAKRSLAGPSRASQDRAGERTLGLGDIDAVVKACT